MPHTRVTPTKFLRRQAPQKLLIRSGDDDDALMAMVKFRRRCHGLNERCIRDAGLCMGLWQECNKGQYGENVFHADPPGQKMEA